MSNARSTKGPAGDGRAGDRDRERQASSLVDKAEELLGEIITPGQWPAPEAVERFATRGTLAQVLALYIDAMRLDPDEPAYPWNVASDLRRLGLSELALPFLIRAVDVAVRVDDTEWTGAAAHIALARTALEAGQPDAALLALARADEAAEATVSDARQIEQLVEEIRAVAGKDVRRRIDSAARLLSA